MKLLMIRTLLAVVGILLFTNHAFTQEILAPGQMPNIISDDNQLHLVYGRNDSILYRASSDRGNTFSPETVISVVDHLTASHTRGPQIAKTKEGIVITACNSQGDIFSFALNAHSGKIT